MSSDGSFRTAESEIGSSEEFHSFPPSPSPPEEVSTDLPAPSSSSSSPPPTTSPNTITAGAMAHLPPPSGGNTLPNTSRQRSSWLRELARGFFNAEPYLIPPIDEPDFEDAWFSELGLQPLQHLVGIPEAYQSEWLEERTVSLYNVPNDIQQDEMREYLKDFGRVEKLPLIIDLRSEQTFRYAIMGNKEEATRVVKLFKLFKLRCASGETQDWLAAPALAPNRGIVTNFHREAGNYVVARDDNDDEPIFAYRGELVPGRTPSKRTSSEQSKLSASAQPFSSSQQTQTSPSPGMRNLGLNSAQALIQEQRYPLGVPPPPVGLANFQTPTHHNEDQYLGYGSTPGLSTYDTPTPRGFGSSAHTSLYQTPSKVNDPKGKTAETNESFYGQYGDGSGMASEQYGSDGYGQYDQQYQIPPRTSQLSQTTQIVGLLARLRKVDKLLQARMDAELKARKDTDPSLSTMNESSAPPAEPVPAVPAVPAPKVSNSMVAVPAITPIKVVNKPAELAPQTSGTQGGPAPKEVPDTPTPVIAEPVAAIPECIDPEPTSAPVKPATPPPAPSSWAAVAGTLPQGSNIINVGSGTLSDASRLKALARIPTGSNPSQNEPLIDQMRVVFLLDIPTTITLTDISNAVQEGPIRSIHFGIDEEKKSRYCAVVFQHAVDALNFTNVLLKERADSKPNRFKFIVDVVRGEDPYPMDDVLRTMNAPTHASRRLTLVKAGFFSAGNKRAVHQKVEKIVGAGAIQILWLYNLGNATIVFSDVGSAVAVKAAFDAWSSNGQEKSFKGLQTTFSKCPGAQPLVLTSALPASANLPL